MNNNKDNQEIVMPNGFKITGNINYYAKRKLEGISFGIVNMLNHKHRKEGKEMMIT